MASPTIICRRCEVEADFTMLDDIAYRLTCPACGTADDGEMEGPGLVGPPPAVAATAKAVADAFLKDHLAVGEGIVVGGHAVDSKFVYGIPR